MKSTKVGAHSTYRMTKESKRLGMLFRDSHLRGEFHRMMKDAEETMESFRKKGFGRNKSDD